MGLVHSPRTLKAIAKGCWRSWSKPSPSGPPIGFGEQNTHRYTAKVGLMDFDFVGHMNNGTSRLSEVGPAVSHMINKAAYLSHAEYARWEMQAQNGGLKEMIQSKTYFIMLGTAIRYRKEIRHGTFSIDTQVYGWDERNVWVKQEFRIGDSPRIAAQLLAPCAAVQGREVINPVEFFKRMLDRDTVDSMTMTQQDTTEVAELFRSYNEFNDALKNVAAMEDEMNMAAMESKLDHAA